MKQTVEILVVREVIKKWYYGSRLIKTTKIVFFY